MVRGLVIVVRVRVRVRMALPVIGMMVVVGVDSAVCMAMHAAMLDVFGPARKFPWTRLVAPELTPELRKQLIDDALEMAKGRSFSDLSTERDAGLVEVARAWKKVGKFV